MTRLESCFQCDYRPLNAYYSSPPIRCYRRCEGKQSINFIVQILIRTMRTGSVLFPQVARRALFFVFPSAS